LKSKILISIFAAVMIMAFLTTGCHSGRYIVGTGPTVNTPYNFENFTEIDVSNTFEYDITRADNFSINISCRQNLVEHLDISQSGQRLIIRLKDGNYTNSDIVATVTLPALTKLTVSGASQGKINGFKSSQDLDISVSGASQLDMNAEATTANLEVTGASKISGTLKSAAAHLKATGASRMSLEGSASADCVLEVTGASTMALGEFKMINADISISGASRATIYAEGNLSMEATGASTIKYSGNPTVKSSIVSGGSKISN
jgi:hypothetical protein